MNSRNGRIWRNLALPTLLLGLSATALAQERLEVTGNVYCRTADDAVERPLADVRVFLKQLPGVAATSGAGNGKFRLSVPADAVMDRDVVLVYASTRGQLGEQARRISREDIVVTAGRMSLQLAPKIFQLSYCADLDAAGLRETVKLALERMSHRAAVLHGELVRAHTSLNSEISMCLDEALSRVGAHLRFAEARVAPFTDALGTDPVRARREVTAIKIADERVSELVEDAEHCMEQSVLHASSQSVKYAPDPSISPSTLAVVSDPDENHPFPWGRKRPGDAHVPPDDDWHWQPGFALETGYDSNYLQKNQEVAGGSSPAAWHFRPSLHLSLRRFDPKVTSSHSLMRVRPVQEANLSLVGMLLTSVQAGGRALVPYSDVGIAADFKNRFGEGGPFGGAIAAKYQRVIEPSIEPERIFSFGENLLGLSAEALMRPGKGGLELGIAYRLDLTYNESAYLRFYDRVRHAAVVKESWLFLPETALVHETEISNLTFVGDQRALNDSTQIRSRMGLVGVITQRTSLEALAGIAESYYGNEHGQTRNYSAPVGHVKFEWFLGPIAPKAYSTQDLVRPSFSLAYDNDFRDNLTSDYYRQNRGVAELSLGLERRWLLALHAGINRIAYSRPRVFNWQEATVAEFDRYKETRIDLATALEYRVMPQLRFSLSLRYDRNLSHQQLPMEPSVPGWLQSLAFTRARIYAGAIWTL